MLENGKTHLLENGKAHLLENGAQPEQNYIWLNLKSVLAYYTLFANVEANF